MIRFGNFSLRFEWYEIYYTPCHNPVTDAFSLMNQWLVSTPAAILDKATFWKVKAGSWDYNLGVSNEKYQCLAFRLVLPFTIFFKCLAQKRPSMFHMIPFATGVNVQSNGVFLKGTTGIERLFEVGDLNSLRSFRPFCTIMAIISIPTLRYV